MVPYLLPLYYLGVEHSWIASSFFVASIFVLVYISGNVFYNVYLHPLRSFPGPWWARSTQLWRVIHTIRGRFHLILQHAHECYGPVIRVSPNELSFASATSWKDIYGQPHGTSILLKSEFYNIYSAGYQSSCIGSERDASKHKHMRQSLAPAFSSKALLDQEHIVSQTIDLFVERLPKAPKELLYINFSKWSEMVAFDILGEMAFGESFGCILSGKPHFWPDLILNHLFFIILADNLRRFPLFPTLAKWLFPYTESFRGEHSNFTRQRVLRRLYNSDPRKDFLTNLIEEVQEGTIPEEEMVSHASTLIIAGGEAVATFLTATIYHLLKPENIPVLSKLTQEIRGHYTDPKTINAASTQRLPYLQAVISEGLRIFPPASFGLPRISVGQLIDGYYVPQGAEIYTSAWAVTHDEKYFPEPMEFKPERWLGEAGPNIREASQPFLLGPRNCIGRSFALMQMSLLLAKLFYSCDLELEDDAYGWAAKARVYIMWHKPALSIRVIRRDIPQHSQEAKGQS